MSRPRSLSSATRSLKRSNLLQKPPPPPSSHSTKLCAVNQKAAMADCRSLIEFCKAFEYNRSLVNSRAALSDPSFHHSKDRPCPSFGFKKLAPSNHPPHFPSPSCDYSSSAAVDIIILLFVLAASGFLFTPYFGYICREGLPTAILLMGQLSYKAPLALLVITFVALIGGGWELHRRNSRKCDNPQCRGLKKAMEFDIQLESEQWVDTSPPEREELSWGRGMELEDDHRELEAELRKMAPPNGRAVLVFRSACGCPLARMEVWGPRKPRRVKK